MASTLQNGKKGGELPVADWRPHFRFSADEVAKAVTQVEQQRFEEAVWLATSAARWPPQQIIRLLIKAELSRPNRNFKFYPSDWLMVA